MKFLALALIMAGSSAFAATESYDIEMNLSMNGKPTSSSRVIVKSGETATITQKSDSVETFIEVVASEGTVKGREGILMNLVVGTIDKEGNRTVVSRPRILTKDNVQAHLTSGNSDGEISLSVLAKRESTKK